MCHLCLAGQPGYDFENMTLIHASCITKGFVFGLKYRDFSTYIYFQISQKNPRSAYPPFMETLDEVDPWDREPCFLKLLHDEGSKASFFKPDVWHTINLGVGRSWISNCIVMLIGALDDLKSMTQDEVLTFLSEDYVHFCESSDPWKC